MNQQNNKESKLFTWTRTPNYEGKIINGKHFLILDKKIRAIKFVERLAYRKSPWHYDIEFRDGEKEFSYNYLPPEVADDMKKFMKELYNGMD